MHYLIVAVIIVLNITVSTLVTQSRWWGLIVRRSLGIMIWLWWIIIMILHKSYKHISRSTWWITLWIRIIAWVVTLARLWSQDTYCRQTPDTIQWATTVDRIWKTDKSYIITQWNHHRIYETKEQLTIWETIKLYAITQKLQTCITTYTHWDIGWKKLQNRAHGGNFDYNRWLVMKWIDGYAQGKIIQQDTKTDNFINPISTTEQQRESWTKIWMTQGEYIWEENLSMNTLENFRSGILEQIKKLFPSSRSAGRVAGTLIGSRNFINKDDYNLLINSGLVHLIVVSGGNLALVILILGFILGRVPLMIRYVLIGWWLIIYVMIVWPDSSVLRALAMAIMTILWIIAGRKWSFGWMLSITTIILLRYNPMIIYDIWLRLSLSAVIGIYITYHEVSRLTHQRSTKRYKQSIRQIILIISVSIGARLGTLPILIWQFGSANLTSIITNSITGIIASITTICELVVIGLSPLLPPAMTQRWVWVVNQLVKLIYWIAKNTVEYWFWIWVSNQWWMAIITWSITILFILLYRHTQKMRFEYLLEIEE